MGEVAISCESISKRYRIGERESYKALRDTLANAMRAPFRRFRSTSSRSTELARSANDTFWALNSVSFEVKRGEVVGIIGRNGAGKSTLLKILSRITKPTSGVARVRGRVGSLLEVGTGFHPELTGRENIFLNGAILGMRKAEIKSRFDDIVAFAEVEKFVDTPVKRYSSGMYVRLAFAVAAHLEPEILLIDEVLAVGDASFQKKCLSKMKEVGEHGRAVFFVSHNMTAITRLCQRAILLDEGRVIADDVAHTVVGNYLRAGTGTMAAREWKENLPGNGIVRLKAVRVRTKEGQITDAIDIRQPVGIEIEFDVLQEGHVLVPNYYFTNEEGVCAFVSSDQGAEWRGRPRPIGTYVSTAWIPGNFLAEGSIAVGAAVSTMDPTTVHFYEADVVAFQVIDSLDGNSARGDYAGHIPGVVRPLLQWTTRYQENRQAAAIDAKERAS